MSASTVKKPDKYQKRVSKYVKVVCKKLQPFRDIFKEKTGPISKNVVSFKNHKVNVVLGSHFIRFRQNILTSFCINESEHNQIELVTKYLCLVKSPFVSEQITFCLAKETEGNSQSAVINFLPNQKLNATLDLEMAQFDMSTSNKKIFLSEKNMFKLFPKYIPIDEETNTSDFTYLRTELDSKAPLCWLDIQAWFIRQKQYDSKNSRHGIMKSKSDTLVACKDPRDPNSAVQALTRAKQARMKRNLRYSVTAEYMKNTVNANDDSSIELVIKLKMGTNGFHYQLRTELLVDCLKSYCFPYRDPNVSIYWVPSISNYFADSYIDEHCQCIVKTSGPVSILFKKKELAVWDTVGHILGIKPRQILNL